MSIKHEVCEISGDETFSISDSIEIVLPKSLSDDLVFIGVVNPDWEAEEDSLGYYSSGIEMPIDIFKLFQEVLNKLN